MLNVFGFLRTQARQAVLGGIADALAEVAVDDRPADLDALRKMLASAGEGAKQLPAAAVTAPVLVPASAEESAGETVKGKRAKAT